MVILTKTHATTEEEMKADLDRFREEIGTDYIDIMLLHLFALSQEYVDCFTIGIQSLAQLTDLETRVPLASVGV